MLAAPGDEEIRDYLSGQQLVGADLEGEALAAWYEDEKQAFTELYAGKLSDPDAYDYHALNQRHGFSLLAERQFHRALSVGGGSGAELATCADRIGRIDVVDAAPASPATLAAPAEFHLAPLSGSLPFPDDTFDLVTCFGVLHHIARVGDTLAEVARVSAPGAWILLREPIVSMGDWRRPRRGLTPHERGIPLPIFRSMIEDAGFEIARERPCMFAVSSQLQGRLPSSLFNNRLLTWMDDWASRATRWNWTYHATSFLRRFRPTSVFYVLRLPGPAT